MQNFPNLPTLYSYITKFRYKSVKSVKTYFLFKLKNGLHSNKEKLYFISFHLNKVLN